MCVLHGSDDNVKTFMPVVGENALSVITEAHSRTNTKLVGIFRQKWDSLGDSTGLFTPIMRLILMATSSEVDKCH